MSRPDRPIHQRRQVAAVLRRAGRPLRARRRVGPPRPRLPQRGQGGARRAVLRRRADPRGAGHELPGIGKTLEEKVAALLATGTIPAVEKLRAKFPPGLVDMTRLPGLGPKKARKLFDELGIDSLGALREAAEEEQLRDVRGFGPKFEASVLPRSTPGSPTRPPHACCSTRRSPSPRGSSRRCARTPRRTRSSWRAARAGRRLLQGPRHHRDRLRPDDAHRAFARLDVIESVAGPGQNAVRAARTPACRRRPRRRARPVRQPPAALHRLEAPQRALREAAVRHGLHVSEYGLLDDATRDRPTAARPRTRSTSASGCRGSRPSCARTAASSRRGDDGLPVLIEPADLLGDLHMPPRPPTAATVEQMARPPATAAWSTSPTPTTRRRTASATT